MGLCNRLPVSKSSIQFFFHFIKIPVPFILLEAWHHNFILPFLPRFSTNKSPVCKYGLSVPIWTNPKHCSRFELIPYFKGFLIFIVEGETSMNEVTQSIVELRILPVCSFVLILQNPNYLWTKQKSIIQYVC